MAEEGEDREYFTFEMLARQNGRDAPRALMSIKGRVFDVTRGRNAAMYGPGLPYSCFVGRDASTAFVTGDFAGAKIPLDKAWDYSVLNAREMAELDGWMTFYERSEDYPTVGQLLYPDESGGDPKGRALDAYDPVKEMASKVLSYRLQWILAEPAEWNPTDRLFVNYPNQWGGIQALAYGTPFADAAAELPPRTCFATRAPPEGERHMLLALYAQKAASVERPDENAVPLYRQAQLSPAPPHVLFWGISSAKKNFLLAAGDDAPGAILGDGWLGPREARERLALAPDTPLLLIFVWCRGRRQDPAQDAALPTTWWQDAAVHSINFAEVSPVTAT